MTSLRTITFALLIFCLPWKGKGQAPVLTNRGDSLAFLPDMKKLDYYFFKKPDTALLYSLKLYSKARQLNNYPVMNYAAQRAGEMYRSKANFPRAIDMQLSALRANRGNKDRVGEGFTYSYIGFTFSQFGDYRQALKFLRPAYQILRSSKLDPIHEVFTGSNLAFCYTKLNYLDSADYFNTLSINAVESLPNTDRRKFALRSIIQDRLGNVFEARNDFESAVRHYRNELRFARRDSVVLNVTRAQSSLAAVFEKIGKEDSSIFYARGTIVNTAIDGQLLHTINAANILARIFKKRGSADSALHYSLMASALKDSVFGVQKFSDLQMLMVNEQQDQQARVLSEVELRNKLRLALVAVVAVALLILALILRRNNRARQIINRQLEQQKTSLQQTLNELQSTQSQLIQSEKMASLGELTAGIAHEIQNPLNFVNNFSDINKELVADLRTEIDQGNLKEAKATAQDIQANEEKINHHGKRADAIVKSMLQHSRKGSEQKELTDINALCDEFLRLSYHGLRAKDKSFNASFKTRFDPSLPKINVVRQDLGRVILNLINNGFYAVNERRKGAGDSYEPCVTISTQKMNGSVHICVSDNGVGIAEKIKDKIFQPFFTTKPAGKGTGLGLSLSYDIVTKGHGGDIKMETKENEGSTFIISIPEK